MIILGITGTLGAGKGTVVQYLVEKYHFEHYSVRKYLTKFLIAKGIEPNRDSFTELANRLRAEHNSPSYLIEELYREAAKSSQNAIIESIRTVGEIDKLKSLGEFYLLSVDGDRITRYQRIVSRKSETDRISYEQFVLDEEREMTATDTHKQNLSACIARADFHLINDGDLNTLYRQVDAVIQKINLAHEPS